MTQIRNALAQEVMARAVFIMKLPLLQAFNVATKTSLDIIYRAKLIIQRLHNGQTLTIQQKKQKSSVNQKNGGIQEFIHIRSHMLRLIRTLLTQLTKMS